MGTKLTYLGDSVYAEFDGFRIVHYTDNGLDGYDAYERWSFDPLSLRTTVEQRQKSQLARLKYALVEALKTMNMPRKNK